MAYFTFICLILPVYGVLHPSFLNYNVTDDKIEKRMGMINIKIGDKYEESEKKIGKMI